MDGRASISAGILARYAGDAVCETAGVRGLVGRRGAKISQSDGGVSVELRVEVEWGVSIPVVGRDVQARVGSYLEQMADVRPERIAVVVDCVGPL